MSIWVCPHCPKVSAEREIEKIEGLARLYAYPCEPRFENGGLVILDSGAFGLAQSGGHMNFAYMQKLSEHYEKYYRAGMICVAPDVGSNPCKSMMNIQKWYANNLFEHICPVLQSETKLYFNERSMLEQAEFYRKYSDKVLIGTPKITGKQAKATHLDDLFHKLKQMGYKWIHKLGVGWNIEDIKYWRDMKYLDSFDSISYYTAKSTKDFGSVDILDNVKTILKIMN